MYAVDVTKAEIADFRFRLPEDLKEAWLAMCDDHKIGIQDSLVGVMRSVLAQDELVRSMLMGQIRPSGDIAAVVMQRLAVAANPRGEFHFHTETERLGTKSVGAEDEPRPRGVPIIRRKKA